MSKLKTISIFVAVFLLAALAISTVSAYNHATFEVSFDSLIYKSDTSGEDRGFSLSRTTRASRWNGEYFDWSYNPNIRHKNSYNSYSPGISDRLALQAFRTFQQDSRDQSRLELEKERNSRYYPRYGHYRYRPYYRYSYRF